MKPEDGMVCWQAVTCAACASGHIGLQADACRWLIPRHDSSAMVALLRVRRSLTAVTDGSMRS